MLASLIPFFLVAQPAVYESAWKYGPEYVFEVDTNFTSTPLTIDGIQQNDSHKFTNVILCCRPKGPVRLICQMEVSANLSVNLMDKKENEEKFFHPFEIEFNNRGVEYLIVDESLFIMKLNTIKEIVQLFSIGTDLTGKPDESFETVENSVIGKCNVTVRIQHLPTKEWIHQTSHRRFQLESLPQLNKVPGEAILIHKKTNLNNCSCYAEYYYGTYGEKTVVEKELPSHLMSLGARIYISDTRFVSSTSKSYTIGSHAYKNLTAVTETVSMTLKDIRPAKEELQNVLRAGKTNLTANSNIETMNDVDTQTLI